MTQQQGLSSPKRVSRLLLVVALVFLSLLILLLVLQLTESALGVWRMLDQRSPILLVLYAVGLFGFSLAVFVLSWLLLRPGKPAAGDREPKPPLPVDKAAFEAALEQAGLQGVDTVGANLELEELARRTDQASCYVAFFGAVSAGKSALIRAITGEQGIQVDPCAGTTSRIAHYRFADGEDADLLLTDAPGILDMNEEHVRIAREEARRAHLVVYVCDGELTRDQHRELVVLQGFQRPMIVALNKQDRYTEQERSAIISRLYAQLSGIAVVAVQAGGKEEVFRIDSAGKEQSVVRERAAKVDGLMAAVQARIVAERELLSAQRDESLVRLGEEKLRLATLEHRLQESEKLVRDYTRKAMVGAMAAVSPGTDVLIQGYLGVQMVRALAVLYEVKARQVDVEHFIGLAGQNVGKRMTLLLALTGNVLKAFPGVGTVTGGLIHAVAYGMIFEGLGNAVVKTLQESGALKPSQALDYFEDAISGNSESRAKYFARLAVEEFSGKR
ncbi:MAG: 50S ribosome-binding GTPase [Candidatus Thiodiazotropha sp. (ex Epidulcina cf. delphinae)]|nr:50S ribosome-binding GTPase [Candidatus Thiodiazotropha sp. (ex Epidulcina cf. delphinae)]